ncbi:MAG: UvrD-helicase domain-containing protein [Hyphomonas oceanitis]|uniref:UvrD-helicase domain-containing protein n=1 Tax=Hyphomonas oceanitis TaxID=81033 RepID=UPI003001A4DA
MAELISTEADVAVRECLSTGQSFALIAGAGSGKTTSLIAALDDIRTNHAASLRQNGQRIACITYTNRAVDVIRTRLGFDELYLVSTLHSFLWNEIGRFSKDIREALVSHRLPALIAKAREKDTGRDTKEARKARTQVIRFEEQLEGLSSVSRFDYADSSFSDYLNGQLSHDDIIEVAGFLMSEKPTFRRLLGLRFPYIFVDEAQDTFECIVAGLNLTSGHEGLPLVGYFGDPWQQIFENRAGAFQPPPGGRTITKTENFRCSRKVIALLNAFRQDVEQHPAGPNKDVEGSVEVLLVQSEEPEEPRRRYSEAQVQRALGQMDDAIQAWGWQNRDDVIRLFLVRQMIARRLGFSELNRLFTGTFASSRAQDDYETGEHFLLKPFISTIFPLIQAVQNEDNRRAIDVLRRQSPSFDIHGANSERKLSDMIDLSKELLAELLRLWETGTTRDVLIYCRDQQLVIMPDRLLEHLARNPRTEDYDEEINGEEKSDWLCDQFFLMTTRDLSAYCNFILENSAYSTQHGVKGEEYRNVLVVFDDVEAAWNQYSFTKLLTPQTAGEPTEGQRERGRKLAYVCFSRAEENLRILLFTPNPDAARQELIESRLVEAEQIRLAT